MVQAAAEGVQEEARGRQGGAIGCVARKQPVAGPRREDSDRVERADDRGVRTRLGRCLVRERYLESAVGAADFILSTMRTADGRLYRTAGVGQQPKLNGYLEDYAFLADALVTLYEATFNPKWLRASIELAEEVMLKHFPQTRTGRGSSSPRTTTNSSSPARKTCTTARRPVVTRWR